jgi:hypothetical protein
LFGTRWLMSALPSLKDGVIGRQLVDS